MTTPRPEPGSERPPRYFSTAAQDEEKRLAGRRLGYAILVALLVVGIGLWLSPPASEDDIPFRHYGVQNELHIMPELSIEEGHDQAHQIPKSLQVPPPPATVDLEPEPESPNATDPRPPEPKDKREEILHDLAMPRPDAEVAAEDQVQMVLPQQSNPDYFILHHVPAEYPLKASEEERRTPIIFVKASMFVGPDGKVSDVLIEATNGSAYFVEEVITKLKMMEFGWRVDPGPGRWLKSTFNFRSPYFTPE